MNKKNKWLNQRIHKKYNNIQSASKHYGDYDNKIILKRKHPLKQRRDRKKFKTQRNRKKVYKRMAFDYTDFIFKNMKENSKRIQIRPTIQYKHHIDDIQSMYYDYYTPDDDDIETYFVNKRYRGNIDGVIVNIQLFYVPYFTKDKVKHSYMDNDWNWTRNIPQSQIQENNDLERAIKASLQPEYMSSKANNKKIKFAATTIKVYGNNIHYPMHCGHQRSGLSAPNIAMNTWNLYKHNLKIKSDYNTLLNPWKVKQKKNVDSVKLQHIFDIYIPFLWSIYPIIFDFIGYKSLQIKTLNATLHLLTKNDVSLSSNQNNGIRYHERNYNSKRRRYSDYDQDIKSYIPTHIYYKTNDDNKYYEIGEYEKRDWNTLTCFSRTKKRIQRKKKKPQQLYANTTPNNALDNYLHHLRCPCGCGRKIRKYSRGVKSYKSILQKRDCVDSKHGWRWKGYRRRKSKPNGWWDFHKTAITVYNRKWL